ncbi:MAG: hypothetical protein WAV72_08715, partial [Bradyrhizobium sp.]
LASTERSQASMRRPPRPFITVYKGRSSKSRTSNPWKIEEIENANANPSLSDASASAVHEIAHDATYLAALKAADAIFRGETAEVPRVPPLPISLPGCVLPSLLQDDVVSSLPARTASNKTRRVRQPARAAETVHAKPKKLKRQTVVVIQMISPMQPAREPEPENWSRYLIVAGNKDDSEKMGREDRTQGRRDLEAAFA